MLQIISGKLPGEDPLLDEAFRHRHRIFVEERGYRSLRRPDGREIDQFDTRQTVHFVAIEGGSVVGYKRMNPTTGPFLLRDVHSHLCDRPIPTGPRVWEWSRFSVAKQYRRDRSHETPRRLDTGNTLIVATLEWAEMSGIDSIVLEFHPLWLTRFLQLRLRVEPLGLPTELEGETVIAARLGFNAEIVAGVRRAFGFDAPVLPAEYHRASGHASISSVEGPMR